MADGGSEQGEAPIGELVGRLIDDGKGYARAELDLAKAKAQATADTLKLPALLLGGALLFLIGAIVTFCMTIALTLAALIGPLGGGLIATVIAIAIAAGLALAAKRKLDASK